MNEEFLLTPNKTALVIDDVMSARMVLSDMLKDLGFSECLEARNGHEALQILQSHAVQIIFCDFMMDGMNGMDFLNAIKSRNLQDTPPIIFVSSIGDVKSVESALKLGASDYLVKPLNFRKLCRKIESALSTKTPDVSTAP